MPILDIIFFIVPGVMTIAVFVILFTCVYEKGKNKNSDKPKSERQLKNEELEQRLKNLFNERQEISKREQELKSNLENSLDRADVNIKKANEIKQTFSEFSKNASESADGNRCKNCGAELQPDKHGRKKCPYCQSKYF